MDTFDFILISYDKGLINDNDFLLWCRSYVPVNSKTTHPPPGQSPGIWLALSSVQWGIWPKMRPARWGIWLSCQNVCQRSWSKRIFQFFDSAGEPRSRVIALVDSTWVFLLLSFYIVKSWNMPLFKVWNEDKLNKKFVVAENFAELVSTVCFTCLEGGGFDPL